MNSGPSDTKEGACSINAQRDQKLSVTNVDLSTSKLILERESPESLSFLMQNLVLKFLGLFLPRAHLPTLPTLEGERV